MCRSLAATSIICTDNVELDHKTPALDFLDFDISCSLANDFNAPSWLLEDMLNFPSEKQVMHDFDLEFQDVPSPMPPVYTEEATSSPKTSPKQRNSSSSTRPQKRRSSEDEEDFLEIDTTGMSRKEKNRIAARRHRMIRKIQDQEADERLAQLNARNQELKHVIAKMTADVQSIKSTLIQLRGNAICA